MMTVSSLIKKKEGEHILYVLRRHWFTFLPKLFFFLVLCLVPFFIRFMIGTFFPNFNPTPLLASIGLLIESSYFLAIILLFYTEFIVFYLDIWIVTNDRIIDIEQLSLFSRTISEVDLSHIQDVTTDVHGIFATLIGYGDVSIKTASLNAGIVFKQIRNPNKVRTDLIKYSDLERRLQAAGLPPTTNT